MRTLLLTCACALSVLATFISAAAAAAAAAATTFSNPLRTRNGSDPFLVHVEGYYYLMTTTWRDLQISRAKTLEGFKTTTTTTTSGGGSETKTIYALANPKPEGNDVWAPELHKINGTWYVFFSEDRKSWVLTGGAHPWESNFGGKPERVHQEWGIDGTIVEIPFPGRNGNHYFVWSCEKPSEKDTDETLQSLCIAEMFTPTSLGPTHILSQPTESWERVEIPVNEGPAGLYHKNSTWIAYSASFCKTPDYQIATLKWDGIHDPLDKKSWTKSAGPRFSSANGNYGTAHNGFFTSPDGTEIWNIYHATQNASGSCGADRQTFAQIVNWLEDGEPDFGVPVRAGEVLRAPSGE